MFSGRLKVQQLRFVAELAFGNGMWTLQGDREVSLDLHPKAPRR